MTTWTGTLPVVAFGEVVDGADITTMLSALHGVTDAWTDYSGTLAWTTSGTNPAIGNGTIQARYLQAGKLVIYVGVITMGSTTTFGSASWLVSVPVAPSTAALGMGAAMCFDSSTGANKQAAAAELASATNLQFFASTLGVVGATAPFTWATSDFLRWTIVYEAA